MAGNLVKNGFTVKAYDLNPQNLEKVVELVCFNNLITEHYRVLQLPTR